MRRWSQFLLSRSLLVRVDGFDANRLLISSVGVQVSIGALLDPFASWKRLLKRISSDVAAFCPHCCRRHRLHCLYQYCESVSFDTAHSDSTGTKEKQSAPGTPPNPVRRSVAQSVDGPTGKPTSQLENRSSESSRGGGGGHDESSTLCD